MSASMRVSRRVIILLTYLRRGLGLPFWDYEDGNRVFRLSLYIVGGGLAAFFERKLEFLAIGLSAHLIFDPQSRFPFTIEKHLAKIFAPVILVSFYRLLHVPYHAVLGVASGLGAGYWLDNARQYMDSAAGQSESSRFNTNRRQRAFDTCAMSMLAELAKADGRITEAEIETIDSFLVEQLRYNNDQRSHAIAAFRRARSGNIPFETYARQFYDNFRSDPAIVIAMLELLVKVAVSDGAFTASERYHIETAQEIFGIPGVRYRKILSRYGAEAGQGSGRQSSSRGQRYDTGPLVTPYQVLGLTDTAKEPDIKKAYRKLVKQYHPDSLVGRGLPKELVAEARKNFQDVQDAYEAIRAQRGF